MFPPAPRPAEPDAETIRRHIDAQTCPWCGRGPFRMLAAHVSKIHDIGGFELREMAGLNATASICSDEVREQRAEALQERGGAAAIAVYDGRNYARPRQWTTAGQRAQSAKGRLAWEAHSRNSRTRNAARDARIVKLWRAGMSVSGISREVGVAWNTAKAVIKRSQE